MDNTQARLVPASPTSDAELATFKPRLRWRRLALLAAAALALFGLYLAREQHRVDALREQILKVRETVLADPVRAYRAVRGTIEELTLQASSTPAEEGPDTTVAPGFAFSSLHGRPGVYLRIPVEAARALDSLALAAREMDDDALPGCLGIDAGAARDLFGDGEFLGPGFVQDVRREDNIMKLRVTETVLAHHIEADLPKLQPLLRGEWLLLALDQKDAPREGTVDMFLWDLRDRRLLLRSRAVGNGVLLSARIRSKESAAKTPLPAQNSEPKVARDCSIATQLHALASP